MSAMEAALACCELSFPVGFEVEGGVPCIELQSRLRDASLLCAPISPVDVMRQLKQVLSHGALRKIRACPEMEDDLYDGSGNTRVLYALRKLG